MRPNATRPRAKRQSRRVARRGMALYIAVMATAMMVTVLGLAGLTAVRIQRREAVDLSDRIAARSYARSGVELALKQFANDPAWRTTYTSGVESTRLSLGDMRGGTVSWVLADADGSLTDDDAALALSGVGRVGDAVQVTSVAVEAIVNEVGPQTLRSMTSTSSMNVDDLRSDKWWCQYVKPSLPAEALKWWVTSIEIYCDRENTGVTVDAIIYLPTMSNWPSTTVIDSTSFSSSSLSSSWSWQSIQFAGKVPLATDQGVCIALTTPSTLRPLELAFRNGGVYEADSALIRGYPAWASYETDKALLYRLNGVYTVAGAGCRVIENTWSWGEAP